MDRRSTLARTDSTPVWLSPVWILPLTLGVFAPVLGFGLVYWDDQFVLLTNEHVHGLSGANLEWMLTQTHLGHYHPLTWLSYAIEYELWGLNPVGYHLTNVLLHSAVASAVWALARRVLARVFPTTDARALSFAALCTALFFALHPLRVESVVWVTERRDVLSALFYVLTVLAWWNAHAGSTPHPRRWWVLAHVLFAASLLSKAWAITLPAVLLILDVYPLRRWQPGGDQPVRAALRLLAEKVPMFAMAAGIAVVSLYAQSSAGATLTTQQHPWGHRLLQCAYGFWFYITKTFVPLRLSPLVPIRGLTFTEPVFWTAAIGVLLTAGVCAFFVWRRRWPGFTVSLAVFVTIAAPVLGLAQSGPQLVADRYSYLSCIPFAVLAGAGALRLYRARGARVAAIAAVLAGVVLAGLTIRQTRVWRSDSALWTQVMDVVGERADWLVLRGAGYSREGDYDRALADLDRAIELAPELAQAYVTRALTYKRMGRLDDAERDLTHAIALSPQWADPAFNRANLYLRMGETDLALADLDTAIARDPDFVEAYERRGGLYLQRAQPERALSDFDRAVRLAPERAAGYNNRGLAHQALGEVDAARADFDRAITLDSELLSAYLNRAALLAPTDPEAARRDAQFVRAHAEARDPYFEAATRILEALNQ